MAAQPSSPPLSVGRFSARSASDGEHSNGQRRSSLARAETSAVYVIEWDARGSTRTPLGTVDELRAAVSRGKSGGGGGGGGDAQRLFVMHGLPEGYVKALRNSLDIDPAFIEAHAARRRYRPLRWRKEARFATYEYPELVRGFRAAGMRADGDKKKGGPAVGTQQDDLMAAPEIRPVSEDGDTAAAFCRASLWLNTRADVLFLDRPLWRDPASPLRKARRHASFTTRPSISMTRGGGGVGGDGGGGGPDDGGQRDGDEISSLEDVLLESLKDAADVGEDDVGAMVAELAYDRWLEFFEELSPRPQTTAAAHDTTRFYWEIAQSLEQNLALLDYLGRRQQQQLYPDWRVLLARLQRRIALLPLLSLSLSAGKAAGGGMVPSKSSSTTATGPGKRFSRNATAASSSARWSGSRRPGRHGGQQQRRRPANDEGQRSLDRVSYLGGILLPFSVASGILSMSEPFRPQDRLFGIFWAVAVPLTLVTIFVIYADIIRKAEVWVEVAAEGVQNAIAAGTAARAPAARTDKEDLDEEERAAPQPRVERDAMNRKMTWYTLGKMAKEQQQQELLQLQLQEQTAGGAKPNGRARRKKPALVPYNDGDEAVVIDMPSATPEHDDDEIEPAPPVQPEDDGDAAEIGDITGEEEDEDEEEEPVMILERPADGSRPKAWRKQQMGWSGAIRTIVGYNRPRREMPLGIPAHERRRTRTM